LVFWTKKNLATLVHSLGSVFSSFRVSLFLDDENFERAHFLIEKKIVDPNLANLAKNISYLAQVFAPPIH
jgi:hypothetical protein